MGASCIYLFELLAARYRDLLAWEQMRKPHTDHAMLLG